MKKITLLYSSAIGLLLVSCSAFSQEARIDSLFSEISNTPGIAAAVYNGDGLLYKKGFGLRNLDESLPITAETTFELGALTMHITASCILQLEDNGQLKLTDPIHKYLTDLPRYTEGTVTVQNLLNHTSGIMDYLIALSMSGTSWDDSFDNDKVYDLIKKNEQIGFTPGQEYEYSNSNYVLLGRIIEKISGKSLSIFSEEQLFKPLGMNSTFYYDDAKRVVPNRAFSYSEEEGNYKINDYFNFNYTVHGEGRLYSTLDDLLLWTKNLDDNKLPIANLEERLIANGVLNDGTKMDYALGLSHGKVRNHNFFAHNGYWAGFSAMFLKFPDLDFWVITLGNNGNISAPSKAFDIANILLDEFPEKKKESKKYRVSKKTLTMYEGNYIGYKNGYLREIFVSNDTLTYKEYPDTERKLIPIGKDLFKVLGTIADYTVQFDIQKGQVAEMAYLRNGIAQYKYELYDKVGEDEIDIDEFVGVYKNTSLDITYELKKEDDNRIAIFVNNEKLMDYHAVMPSIFCSESTHHGYLNFSETRDRFTLSDYSFKPILFEKFD